MMSTNKNVLKGKDYKLEIPGKTLIVNMNDYSKMDYDKIEGRIQRIIASSNRQNGSFPSSKKKTLRPRRRSVKKIKR